jgi:hypothetical protein
MKTAFLYDAEIKSPAADEPIRIEIVYRGVDQARLGISAHFRVPIGDVKVKLQRNADGSPREVFCETTAGEEGEQCWADANGRDRCANKARSGFHTCKIHTSFDAPAPFGTPEYESWISKPASPRKRRARATDAKTRADSSPAKPKPANRVSRARRKRRKP